MNSESIHFTEAAPSDLIEVRRFVEMKSLDFGISEDAAADVVIAVNEAVTNIMVHGYGPTPGPIEIAVSVEGADIIVALHDRAVPFDPNSVDPPDITVPLQVRKPGGMGVHMMRSYVDELIYRQSTGGMNVLLLVKRGVVSASGFERSV
jgi:serine/threonine-protein kinase RsbW